MRETPLTCLRFWKPAKLSSLWKKNFFSARVHNRFRFHFGFKSTFGINKNKNIWSHCLQVVGTSTDSSCQPVSLVKITCSNLSLFNFPEPQTYPKDIPTKNNQQSVQNIAFLIRDKGYLVTYSFRPPPPKKKNSHIVHHKCRTLRSHPLGTSSA